MAEQPREGHGNGKHRRETLLAGKRLIPDVFFVHNAPLKVFRGSRDSGHSAYKRIRSNVLPCGHGYNWRLESRWPPY